jgi:hypothetical protein
VLDHTVLYPEHFDASPEKSPEKELQTDICKNYFDPTPPSPEPGNVWNLIANCDAQPIADLPAS